MSVLGQYWINAGTIHPVPAQYWQACREGVGESVTLFFSSASYSDPIN